MSLERRQAWPALAIMGVGILTLAVVLKSAQSDMPVQPPWIMAGLVVLYLVLALLAEGFRWRALLLLVAMAAAHAFTALLMGWGYSAVEGNPRAVVPALQHGLWDYLPGTALQFGFACMVGIVLDMSLEAAPEAETDEKEPVERVPVPVALPDLETAPNLQAALDTAAATKGIAAALTCNTAPLVAGVWARDPEAAWRRVRAMIARGGTGLNSIPLDTVSLLIRAEGGRAAALLVTADLDQRAGHEVLRRLWAAAQKEWGTDA